MKRIYLDSNVLIAHCSVDRAEETKKKMVENALAVFAGLKDIQLCTSMWAVTEMVNIPVSSKKMDRAEVSAIEDQLVSERRLRELRVHFVDVSPRKDYDFPEFFYHVKQGILQYHSGVGDVIHSVIMKNNGITEFVRKCNAKYRLISTACGRYESVPHPMALKRYKDNTVNDIRRTDIDGSRRWTF